MRIKCDMTQNTEVAITHQLENHERQTGKKT